MKTQSFLIGSVFGSMFVFAVVAATALFVKLNEPPLTELRLKDAVTVTSGPYDGRQGLVIGYDYETSLYGILDTAGFKFMVPEAVLKRSSEVIEIHTTVAEPPGEST